MLAQLYKGMPDLIHTFVKSANERETVPYFLFRYIRWNEQRRTLVDAVAPSFVSRARALHTA